MTQDMDNAQIHDALCAMPAFKEHGGGFVRFWSKVVNLDPANKAARLMLISSAVKKEDYRQIIRISANRASKLLPMPGSLLLFGYRLQSGGAGGQRAERGVGVGHVTPDTRKDDFGLYTRWATLYHAKKQMTEAYAAYDSALVYNPFQYQCVEQLCLLLVGRTERPPVGGGDEL